MDSTKKTEASITQPIPAEAQGQDARREEYSAPKVTRFGTIQKLTGRLGGSTL